MIASILRIPANDVPAIDLFKRFLATPGLVHAYRLRPVIETEDTLTVSIWENAAARDAYMATSTVAAEVNERYGTVRALYEVEDSK